MSIWIPEYLSKDVAETSDDQTLYIDLPKNEQISHLKIEIRITNTSTVNNLRSILDPISKFEIIADGMKSLFNLEPECASYSQFVANNGIYPDHRFFDGASLVPRLELIIPFGRYPFDPDYMLDTSLYNNVQLRIPYALNTTYEATGTLKHTIQLFRPLEKLNPVGLIRRRTVKKETSSGSAETIIHDLPMSLPWHYVYVRIEDVDADINTNLSAVKLNVDEGRLILLDLKADEINYADRDRFPAKNCYINVPVVTGQEYVHTFADWAFVHGAANITLTDTVFGITQVGGERVLIKPFKTAGTEQTVATGVALYCNSPNPHKCLTIFDGRKEAFDAGAYSEAKIEFELNAYTMNLITCIEEIVTGKLT